MKTRNILFTATICTLMTACSITDEIGDNGAVRFTAGINQATASQTPTRAAETNWAAGDAIGIFMIQGGAALAANKQHTTPGTGTFTATAGNEMYYPMDGSTVIFTAYYPYTTTATALTTPLPIKIATAQTAANQPTFDLLYIQGVTASKAAGATPVALHFTHQLAKIVMNCTADANVGASLAGMTVTLQGMNTESTFDLKTGLLGTAGTVADITPRTITDGTAYDAIILPGTYADGAIKVTFEVGTETYTWTLTAAQATFAATNEYTYAVNLTRTGVEVTGTINDWGPNDMGTVTAE